MLGIIPENLAYLPDCRVDAVFRVYKNSLAPKPFFDLLPAYKSSLCRHQQHQQFHRDFFELPGMPPVAQLIAGTIQLKFFEFDHTWGQSLGLSGRAV
jgi:hypothetical protein